jgi:ankyrin repeat protein
MKRTADTPRVSSKAKEVKLTKNLASFSEENSPSIEELIEAIKQRDATKAIALVARMNQQGLSKTQNDGWTVLHEAAIYGMREVCEVLIPKVSPEIFNTGTITVLYLAAREGMKKVCELLIPQIAPDAINVADKLMGETALHFAAKNGMTKVCTLILNKCPEAINTVTHAGKTVLHFAALGGNKGLVELILQKAPEAVNVIDKEGVRTALQEATAKGYREICELLIPKMNPEAINSADRHGYTALSLAASHNSMKPVCELLISKMNFTNIRTHIYKALCNAAGSGDKEIFELLMPMISGESINIIHEFGWTVLHYAAKGGNKAIFEAVLNMAPETINIFNGEGEGDQSLLHIAARQGHTEICELLLSKMPEDVNAFAEGADGGQTPLHLAAMGGYKKICELILKKFPEAINIVTYNGDATVLHWAAMGSHGQICEFFLKQMPPKPIYEAGSQNSETSLHFAAREGHREICEFLVDTMHVKKIAELLSQSTNDSLIQYAVSEIIADFIGKRFFSKEYSADYLSVKLLKLYQIVDQDLLKYYLDQLSEGNSNSCINSANNYIIEHYFTLIGVCKSIEEDNPISILGVSNDCVSHVLSYLAPSLWAPYFTSMGFTD